ncbi:MAG: DNA topoisomerase 4 subunit A, partial [Bacilli bacterium]|nr:DNA topoisomerase 4 subunit A [Bacilli bacterium]
MAKKKPEAPTIIEQIVPSTLDDLMGERFDIYAKDVIQDRAIPDARDGMKPVQRRIIYAMYKAGNTIDKPTKKCAHIVGDVMGKYHPHGDSSIYEALVRMSQTWNVRLPLIDFQGNNGSMDGDGPAAYRYTEARLAAVSQQLIADLDKDTVDMGLTFDDVEYEPTVLPSRFPNLFVNGAQGIAVGMATDIPTHNLREIIQAVIYRIQHPSCPIESLMRFVPGPDFPTGGIIYQSQGLADIYLTGRGRIDIASRTEIGQSEDGTNQIIITEIPYQVRKQGLIFAIDKIRHEKTIAGITEVRDETDKSGLRIVVDIKDGFKPESILAYLMSKTELRSTYNANMVAIVDGRPVTLNLLSYCDTYIAHQRSVITRRSRHDLSRALARLEIVEGLVRAGAIIDEIVRVIKASKDKADSKVNLQKEFGFTETQSEAIVMMPLYKISHFDVAVVLDEKAALDKEIAELRSILANPEKLDGIIVSDLRDIAKKYGDDRRTSIEEEDVSLRTFKKRDLVARETVV